MKKIIGTVLLILAVLFSISAALGIGRAPNISYAVGTFMPGLFCAIIGLVLFQGKVIEVRGDDERPRKKKRKYLDEDDENKEERRSRRSRRRRRDDDEEDW